MAKKKKKDFKSGLSSIIEQSLSIFSEEPADSEQIQQLQEQINKLQQRINLLERELYLWRTGKLTVEKFNQSLKEHGLRYNPTTNTIEKAQ